MYHGFPSVAVLSFAAQIAPFGSSESISGRPQCPSVMPFIVCLFFCFVLPSSVAGWHYKHKDSSWTSPALNLESPFPLETLDSLSGK